MTGRTQRHGGGGERALVAMLLGAVLLPACEPPGTEPRNRLTLFEPPDGSYRLYYLEPPWALVEATETTVFLRVRSAVMARGLEAGLGRFELEGELERGVANVRADADLRRALRAGELLEESTTLVTPIGLPERVEFRTRLEDPTTRFKRYVYYQVDAGTVLRLVVSANTAVNGDEVTAMLELVEVGPPP